MIRQVNPSPRYATTSEFSAFSPKMHEFALVQNRYPYQRRAVSRVRYRSMIRSYRDSRELPLVRICCDPPSRQNQESTGVLPDRELRSLLA